MTWGQRGYNQRLESTIWFIRFPVFESSKVVGDMTLDNNVSNIFNLLMVLLPSPLIHYPGLNNYWRNRSVQLKVLCQKVQYHVPLREGVIAVTYHGLFWIYLPIVSTIFKLFHTFPILFYRSVVSLPYFMLPHTCTVLIPF